VEQVAPNPGHYALAQLEQHLPQVSLFTQNVDNLHERAGSQQPWHLHGSITQFCCNRCAREHVLQPAERTQALPPRCRHCGDQVRPAVVWFGEMLPPAILQRAWRAVEQCDVMLVVGTSGIVYPAAQLPFTARQFGAQVIDVNPEPNAISASAELFLQGASGVILPQVVAAL
jgi:NAD-dependent deacetylase